MNLYELTREHQKNKINPNKFYVERLIDLSTKYKVNIRDLYVDFLMYKDMGLKAHVSLQYIDYKLGLGTEYHTIDDEVNKQ